jgi:MSHA pilin protein MshA
MKEQGFTLIELVMVIVILGVLSAIALPKFVDLSTDAQQAATTSVAGAISSASAINYATRKVSNLKGIQLYHCDTAFSLLQGGQPTGYSFSSDDIFPFAADTTVTCTVLGPKNTSATATVTGVN